jgi:hypothetical protein
MDSDRPTIHYLGFTLDTPPQQAEDIFFRRYGVKPEKVFKIGVDLWAGPIPQDAQRAVTTSPANMRHTS